MKVVISPQLHVVRITDIQNATTRVDHCLGAVRDRVARDDDIANVTEPEGGARTSVERVVFDPDITVDQGRRARLVRPRHRRPDGCRPSRQLTGVPHSVVVEEDGSSKEALVRRIPQLHRATS